MPAQPGPRPDQISTTSISGSAVPGDFLRIGPSGDVTYETLTSIDLGTTSIANSGNDLVFTARGASIPLNEAGQETLQVTGLTATSIVGAINEINDNLGSDLATTLTLGNTTGGNNIILSTSDALVSQFNSGAAGSNLLITAAAGDTNFVGGSVNITAGSVGGGSGGFQNGGDVNITGGLGGTGGGARRGGNVILTGGTGGSDSAPGAILTVTGGYDSDDGGDITLVAGDGVIAGDGGNITITAGDKGPLSGGAGDITITAGRDTVTGGAVTITAGFGDNILGGPLTLSAGSGLAGGPAPGGHAILQGGGSGTAGGPVGGNASLIGGAGLSTTAASSGGTAFVTGGAGGPSFTNSHAGGVTISGGTPTDGNGGAISISGSDGAGSNGDGGGVTIRAGTGGGSGVDGTIDFYTGGTNRWSFNASGDLIASTDNVYDIGNGDGTAPGENRPRKVFVGTEVVVGDTITIGTNSITGSDGITITPGGTGSLMIDGDLDVTGSLITSFDYLNVGTVTDATTSGDFATGLDGMARMVYDQNTASIRLYNAAGVDYTIATSNFIGIWSNSDSAYSVEIQGGVNPYIFLTDLTSGEARFAVDENKTRIAVASSWDIGWSSTTDADGTLDLGLDRVAAGILGLRDPSGGVGSEFRVYDAASTSYISLTSDGTRGIIATTSGDTIRFSPEGTGRWEINASGTFYPLAGHSIGSTLFPVQNLYLNSTLDFGSGDTVVRGTGVEGVLEVASGVGPTGAANGGLLRVLNSTEDQYAQIRFDNTGGGYAELLASLGSLVLDSPNGLVVRVNGNNRLSVTNTLVSPQIGSAVGLGWIGSPFSSLHLGGVSDSRVVLGHDGATDGLLTIGDPNDGATGAIGLEWTDNTIDATLSLSAANTFQIQLGGGQQFRFDVNAFWSENGLHLGKAGLGFGDAYFEGEIFLGGSNDAAIERINQAGRIQLRDPTNTNNAQLVLVDSAGAQRAAIGTFASNFLRIYSGDPDAPGGVYDFVGTTFTPGAAGTYDLGSSSKPWGSLFIGDASGNIEITHDTAGNLQIDSDLVFATDNTYDIGNGDGTAPGENRPRKVFVGTEVVVGNTAIGTNATDGLLSISDPTNTSDAVIRLYDAAGTSHSGFGYTTNAINFHINGTAYYQMFTGSFTPINGGAYDLGSTNNREWRRLYLRDETDSIRFGVDQVVSLGKSANDNIQVTDGGIIFDTDNVYDIGNDDATAPGENRPRKVFVGTEVVVGNTVTIGTNSINMDGVATIGVDAAAAYGQGITIQDSTATTGCLLYSDIAMYAFADGTTAGERTGMRYEFSSQLSFYQNNARIFYGNSGGLNIQSRQIQEWRIKVQNIASGGPTSPYGVTPQSTGGFFTNIGATGTVVFELPASTEVSVGARYKFYRVEDQTVRVQPDDMAANAIIVAAGKQPDNNYIELGAVGSSVELILNSQGDWMAVYENGTINVEV